MKPFVDTCIRFFKKETVLCVAGILAFISAFFVHPSAAYIGYIDFRVLSLLFCLMLVVAGFQSIGLFHFLGSALLTKVRTTRQLILVLSLLCFFSSMFITNDVSLLTFVPFGIMILTMTGQQKLLISTIVLQTIGANLGSMFTPGEHGHPHRQSPEPVSGLCLFCFHRDFLDAYASPYSPFSDFAGCGSLHASLCICRHSFPTSRRTTRTEKAGCLPGSFCGLSGMRIPPDPISCYAGSRPRNFAFYQPGIVP